MDDLAVTGHLDKPESDYERLRREEHNRGQMLEIFVSSHMDRLPANPPPGPKWQARTGLYRLGLNGAEHDVMGCLINRASKASGLCFPFEHGIVEWTNRPLRTVQRAIAELRTRNLIAIVEIGCKTGQRNRYYINWPPLFAAYEAIKAIETGRPPKVAGTSERVPPKVACR